MMLAMSWFGIGPGGSLIVFGVRLIGLNAANGRKLLLTLGFIATVLLVGWILRLLSRLITKSFQGKRIAFWVRQAIHLLISLMLLVGILSIWFSNSTRLATFLGLVTAGLAFALQKVVTAFAGYIVILRGNTFTVGDRIVMGGVRGDVIKLGFIQTTIMEMGQPPGEQQDDPAMWVHARQYTGRIVTVTNDKIFDTPVYNYTKELPYIWDEMRIPIGYKDKRDLAEKIILAAVNEFSVDVTRMGEAAVRELEDRYLMKRHDMHPRVYFRLTDNWIEMTVRFIAVADGVRAMKDKISRRLLAEFDAAQISIASSTYDIVGVPPIKIIREDPKQP